MAGYIAATRDRRERRGLARLTQAGERYAFETTWGATWQDGTARFRLWAPQADRLTLRLDGRNTRWSRSDAGWFEA